MAFPYSLISLCPGQQAFTLFWPIRGLKDGADLTFARSTQGRSARHGWRQENNTARSPLPPQVRMVDKRRQ